MLKRIWKDPVWASVIAAGIGGISSYLAGWWPAIVDSGKAVWVFMGTSSPVSHCIVALLALIALPTLIVGVMLAWQLVRSTSASNTDWHAYTEDKFFGLRWRWSYSSIGQIQRVTTFCPHCDYQVFWQDASAYAAVERIGFHCDSCHSTLGEFSESFRSLESKTERFIQQKVRNGTWAGPVAASVPESGKTQ